MNVRVICASCKKVFLRPTGKAHEAQKFKWKQYCSPSCLAQMRRRGQELRCGNPECTAVFYRPLKDTSKVKKSYCSRSCAASVNNQKFPKRVAVSTVCEHETCSKHAYGGNTYCSRACFNAARRAHSPAELIQKLQDTSRTLQRPPTKREMGPVAYMCVRAFGSWNSSLRVAGLTPHRSHSQRMFKRTNTVALDGHKCDSISEAVIDNWLTRNGMSHVRNAPYPETGCKADWSLGGSVFVEYFGLAHDSPRYDRSIQKKRALCEKHRIRLIEIYPKDLYPAPKFDEKFKKINHPSAP